MKRRGAAKKKIAKELTSQEITQQLERIGAAIQAERQAGWPSADDFAYEVNIARSNMYRVETGHDMYLSTFLKILAGLDLKGSEFFKEVEKK